MKTPRLPPPECEHGYSDIQLKEILHNRYDDFCKYMIGQTGMICDGREYDIEQNKYVPSDCGPHGMITYKCDLETFLEGKPTLD